MASIATAILLTAISVSHHAPLPVGDCPNVPQSAEPDAGMEGTLPSADVPLPRPIVTLTFGLGCNDRGEEPWRLSSETPSEEWTIVPLGKLRAEVHTGEAPIDFVKLLVDRMPLAPTQFRTIGPHQFELPCPTPGKHVLQARYSQNDAWSELSRPLRFDVRLPKRPRIVGVSDTDNETTPLAPGVIPSITTAGMKVRLGDVGRNSAIAAYVDGKQVDSTSANEGCCRNVRLRGFISPGVHELTVRSVACPKACSITSDPSNLVTFHYYESSQYVLSPGWECCSEVMPTQAASTARAPSFAIDRTTKHGTTPLTSRAPAGDSQTSSANGERSQLE